MLDQVKHNAVTTGRPDSELTQLDRAIIVATQDGLPLVSQPYQLLADQLNVPVELVIQRIEAMQESGVIRRIAAVPNHFRLGYRCNGMSVWDVDDERIAQMGKTVGELEFVSHAYHRPRRLPEWPYNLFAMVHGKSRDEVMVKAELIEKILGDSLGRHDILFSVRILKKTGLRLSPGTTKDPDTYPDT
jgi:DNA-binding Lrp family transcriptional regulator